MDLNHGQFLIEKLYPFYLCLNEEGLLVGMGRSATKCFLNSANGVHFSKLFKVVAPRAFNDSSNLNLLRDKIVNIQSLTTGISLNGEMLFLPEASLYLFAVSPVIQDIDALTKYNLSYSDFPVFSPVFDFLILTQAERFARKEQSKALNALEEQNTFAKLNLEIANFCSRCSELQDAFDFVIYTLQNFLNVRVSFEKSESSMPPEAQFHEQKISIPLIVENKLRVWLHLESESAFSTSEPLKIFLGSLRFTLENLITRMDQFNSLQEAQVLKLNSSKMYTLGEMAAGIAHELNNPLAVIQGVAWLTLTKLKSSEVASVKIEENMNKILKMTERSSKIINGLRVFARDAAEDPMEKIEISSIVQETLELCKTRIAHRGIRLDVQLKAQYHSWGRPVQISQVLLNLLNNATDAIENTEDAWIRIDVRKKDEFWVVTVTDSGNGIPKEIVEKMMSPFFTTKPPGKGTGLGLSISGSILKNHGGEFWYDSHSPNTTFCFSLPVLATLQP